MKFFYTTLSLVILLAFSVNAQYYELPQSGPDVEEYVGNPANMGKSLMYVFYDNSACNTCAEAMGMIYNLYQQNYTNQFNLYEINYSEDNAFNFRIQYNLTQPLSIVLVKIENGKAVAYYKIDNPQYWVGDAFIFNHRVTNQINNFINSQNII